MRKWLMCGVVISVLLPVFGCATLRSGSPAKHPVPPAIEKLSLDRCWLGVDGKCSAAYSPERRLRFSLASEDEVRTDVAYTYAAWQVQMEWLGHVLRAYCESREALQVANGEIPKPAPACEPVSK